MFPNLCRVATKELFQDAFLTWLLDWLNVSDHELGRISQQFVDRLAGKAGIRIDWAQFSGAFVRQQFYDVDVVVVLTDMDDRGVCFAVEDKLGASAGPGQLQKNLDAVIMHRSEWPQLAAVSKERIVGVFLKAKYDFDYVAPPGYVKWNYSDFRQWLDTSQAKQQTSSGILRDWSEWYSEILADIDCWTKAAQNEVVLSGASTRGTEWDNLRLESNWSNSIFQYELFKRLFRVAEFTETKEVDKSGYQENVFRPLYDGSRSESFLLGNSKGRSWIQYWFNDEFFYRLDWRDRIWGISLRYYKEPKTHDDIQKMEYVADILSDLLKSRNIATRPFRSSLKDKESTCLLIDPSLSPGLADLFESHVQFVQRAGLKGPRVR
jgi:hypothetical protein